MAAPKPVAKMAQQRQTQRGAALRLASQNARQGLHNGPAFPGIPQGVENIALEHQGIRPPIPGGIGIGHAPVFTGPPALLNETELPNNGGYAPGQLTPGGGGIQQPQQPVIDPNTGGLQADAQGGYISGNWNDYVNYANSRGITPFAGPGSTYGGNPINNPGGALQQAMVNASQSGANSNPNTIQPTPVQPVIPAPNSAPPVVSSPVTSVAPNPQQLGNQNIPGYTEVIQEGGQPTANRILPRPGVATRPIIHPLGNMMGSGFGGAASRLMGRL